MGENEQRKLDLFFFLSFSFLSRFLSFLVLHFFFLVFLELFMLLCFFLHGGV